MKTSLAILLTKVILCLHFSTGHYNLEAPLSTSASKELLALSVDSATFQAILEIMSTIFKASQLLTSRPRLEQTIHDASLHQLLSHYPFAILLEKTKKSLLLPAKLREPSSPQSTRGLFDTSVT